MIEGVQVKKLVRHCDDRGFFMEILRDDDSVFTVFGQASMTRTYPGVVRAFHYHEHQDDLWFFPVGEVQAVLHDLRENSPTRGETNVFFMGESNPILLLIPRMVAHGYRVLGERPSVMVYFTTNAYNREKPDEMRLEWDDPAIGFDWSTKNR